MLEPESRIIDGVEFNFIPMDPFVVIELEKRLAPLLLPIIGGLKALDLDAELSEALDLEALVKGMQQAIRDLPGAEFVGMAKTLLKYVSTTVDGVGVVGCDAAGARIFQGNSMLLYKVCVEAMRYNKFVPFALGGLGGATKGIVSSLAQTAARQANGLKLDRSAP